MFTAILRRAAAAAFLATAFAAPAASAQEAQPRLAWIVGESAYAGDVLPSVAADSALIAKTLAAQGFDVSEAHDLDTPGLASAYQAFLVKVRAAPPGGAVTVYLAGLGVTVGCDDFLLPVDAQVRAAEEVPPNSLSMKRVMNDLAQTNTQVRLVSLDASRPIPSSVSSVAFPKGLIPLAPPSATAFALGAEVHDFEAPPKEGDVDDAYAPAFAAALQQPFTDIGTTLHAARIAAHQASGGAQTPWLAIAADMPPFAFVANATPDEAQQAVAALPAAPGPLASMSADTAYWTAIWRNSVADYQAFIAAFAYTAPADEVQRVNYLISLLTIPNPVCQGSAATVVVPVEPPPPAPVIEIPEPVYTGPVCPDGFEPRFERGVDYCAPIDIGTQCPFGSTPVVVDGVTYCHIISVCPPESHPVWNGHGWFCHQPCRWSEAGCPCPPGDPRCHRPWPCRPGDPDCRPPEPCHPGERGCRLPPVCHPGEPGCRLPPDCHPGEPGCRPPLMCPPGAQRNPAGVCEPGASPSATPTASPTGSCPAGEHRNPKGACMPGAPTPSATPTLTPSATPTPTASATPSCPVGQHRNPNGSCAPGAATPSATPSTTPTPKPTHTLVHPTLTPMPILTPTHTFVHPKLTPTHTVTPLHTVAPIRTFSPQPTPLVRHPIMTTAPHPAPPHPTSAPHPADHHPPCGQPGEPKC